VEHIPQASDSLQRQDILDRFDISRRTLTEIAESVGFSLATLRDQFKRQFGMTPTEYRQNL